MDELDGEIKKGGETIARIGFRRSIKGLRVSVWANPLIEETFRGWSGGTGPLAIAEYGRYWRQIDTPLSAYQMTTDLGVLAFDGGMYTLNAVGRPLLDKGASVPDGIVNLGLLRLVGISSGAGVRFTHESGPISLPEIRRMKDRLLQASRRFYIDYVMPVDITITLNTQVYGSSQEIRL